MKITFGDTDGECERRVVGALIGYTVCVTTVSMAGHKDEQDWEIAFTDEHGFSGFMLDDEGLRMSSHLAERWINVEEIHVY